MTMINPPAGLHPPRLRRLLRRMIDIYSPSGKEEEILEYLHGYLKRQGLPVIEQEVDDNRYNLVVVPPETEVSLVLIGHVDTVMAYDLESYGYDKQADMVLGLGASDMKGGCAAMIEAYRTAWQSSEARLPVALALVVGEEEDGDGAVVLGREFHFPWALVGEPTNLQPCLSHYGYLEVQSTTSGKRMHASLANKHQNPIDAMLRFLLKITHYMESQRPEMVYNLRDLSSSHAGFAVPDRCDAWLDVHLPPTAPVGEIILEMEEMLRHERSEAPGFNGTLRFATVHGGYTIPEKGWPVEILKQVFAKRSLPWEPQAFRSHSDANLLWEAGMKPILLGPGELARAHAPDEAVSFQQVCLAAELYHDLLLALSKVQDEKAN
jgi:acetylornithine deacetylase